MAECLKKTKKVQCFCESFKCNGKLVTQRDMKRHIQKDYIKKKEKRKVDGGNSPNLAPICPWYPRLYDTHWTSTTRLYKDSEHSVLEYIYLELKNFVSHPSHTKAAVTTNLETVSTILPQPNNGFNTFTEARDAIKEFLLPLKKYDVCPNDCTIFTGINKDKKDCPVCHSPRFKGRNPQRIFKYFPLAPRIGRLYQDKEKNLVKLLQSHCTREEDGFMRDLWDTSRWKGWYEHDGEFKGDTTGCTLNFCSDGVNPFRKMHVSYSMWPLMLSIMNFPPSLRKSLGGILLVGIIPSNGRKEPYHLDPYLDLIVNELLTLCDCHIFYPAYMDAPVKIKTRLLQFVLDFPAISKVMHQPSQGAYQACPWCKITGTYSKAYHKTIYMDGRRYLQCGHCLRFSKSFTGTENEAYSPHDEVTKRKRFDKLPNENQKKKFTKENGVKGSNSWMRLPYHKMHEHYLPDGMHTLTDVVQNILSWLIGEETNEKLLGGETEQKVVKKGLYHSKVSPMTDAEKDVGNKRCHLLEFPKQCAGGKGDIFIKPKVTLGNTHGWTEYTALRIWRFLLKDALELRQRRTLLCLFQVLSRMHEKKYTLEQLTKLEEDTNVALALMERDCPLWLCNITTHLLHHITGKIRENGPIFSSWMYPYERVNSWLTRRANNRSKVEECIMETYQAYDWVCFSQFLGKFSHLEKGTRSKIATHVFQRDGIVDLQVIQGTPETLNHRQQDQASTNSSTVSQHKQLDKILPLESDITYYPGDYVFISGRNRFAQIEALLVIDSVQWADLSLFDVHNKDDESGLFYVDDDLPDIYEMQKLTDLSAPLVTCEQYGVRWFVSYFEGDESFNWYNIHISL